MLFRLIWKHYTFSKRKILWASVLGAHSKIAFITFILNGNQLTRMYCVPPGAHPQNGKRIDPKLYASCWLVVWGRCVHASCFRDRTLCVIVTFSCLSPHQSLASTPISLDPDCAISKATLEFLLALC